jgi:hypothetical protein
VYAFTTKHKVVVRGSREEFELVDIAYGAVCKKLTKPVCTYYLDESSLSFLLSLKDCTVTIINREYGIAVKEYTCGYFIEKLKEINE